MSFKDANREVLSKKVSVFSGGYVDNIQEIDMGANYSPFLRNARLDGQSIESRPGHTLHSTLTAGSYPKGIGSYLRTTASGDRLIVRHNTDATHKLYTIETDGTATSITTSSDISSDNRMSFTNIEDVVYCMNGSDDFGQLSGTTYTTPSTGITNFAPSFSVVFNSSHWASGWSTNPNVVYKSVADDYVDFNSAGKDEFTFAETITGLAATKEALFYFTKNTISVTGAGDVLETSGAITYNNRALETQEGSINHASIVTVGNKVYYVTPGVPKINQVIRGADIDGFESLPLSERAYKGISKIMSTLATDQVDSFGYFIPKDNLIKRFFKSVGAAINDVCIIYDITKDAFLVDSQKFFYGGVHFKGANYTISMIESKVFRDEHGYDDEDAPIPFKYKVKNFYLSGSTFKTCLRASRTLVDINQLASLKQTIFVDGKEVDDKTVDKDNITLITGGIGTEEIGTEAVGTSKAYLLNDMFEVPIIRTKGNLNVKGRTVQFSYENNTVGGRVRLKDINIMKESLPEMSNELTV